MKLPNPLKRNAGIPIEGIAEKIEEATIRMEKLQRRKTDLIEKKRTIVLDGEDAMPINEEISKIDQQIADISTILLPSLNEKLKEAKAGEEDAKRQKRIQEVLAEEEKLYVEIAENISIVTESKKQYQKSLDRLIEIKESHNDNLRKLSELGTQRNPNLDWNILLNFLRRLGK